MLAQDALSRDDLERRRLDAAQELLRGVSQSKVARRFGVSRTTASRWHRALWGGGTEALKKRRATGRPSRLTTEQRARIVELFHKGALTYGFPKDRWTTARLGTVIEAEFGVRYDPDHVGRLMHKLGLSKNAATRQDANATPAYAASLYSPNTDLSRSEISPTVA